MNISILMALLAGVLVITVNCDEVKPNEVAILIRNMHYKRHREKAETMRADLVKQSKSIQEVPVLVFMLHESWANEWKFSSWTLLPIFSKLVSMLGSKVKWVFFCEESTEINLKGVLNVLSGYDDSKDYFLGHALFDTEAAIIHHFKFHQDPTSFKYPDFDSGWAISIPLLKKIIDKLSGDGPIFGFTIDLKHEIAIYLLEQINGTKLTDVPEFCVNKKLGENNCVSTVNYAEPNCGSVDPNNILIAVKTCEKFHKERVPVVQKTVGLHAKHIRYYSDVADSSIPTEYIGVNNTERGHCAKLERIIHKGANEEWKNIKWLVIIDDDTIMNYNRLRKLLACYDPQEFVMLGERYGYGLPRGYEYPTGGGGMVLSRYAVNQITSRGMKCGQPDNPDDMWLGSLSKPFDTPMVNTNSFHQARPSQYSRELLSHQYLISFHKHFMVDPMKVYQEFLEDKTNENTHKIDEL